MPFDLFSALFYAILILAPLLAMEGVINLWFWLKRQVKARRAARRLIGAD